jgi:FLVCR family feline leukemia virus subgroup C receptor-related protein
MDENEIKAAGQGTTEYALSKFRYIEAVVFALGQVTTSIIFPTFNPVTTNVESSYGVSEQTVTSVSLVYLLTFPITAFPANGVIDRRGIRFGFLIGAMCVAIGVWVRTLVNSGFYFTIIGQVIAGLGRPFILNSQA